MLKLLTPAPSPWEDEASPAPTFSTHHASPPPLRTLSHTHSLGQKCLQESCSHKSECLLYSTSFCPWLKNVSSILIVWILCNYIWKNSEVIFSGSEAESCYVALTGMAMFSSGWTQMYELRGQSSQLSLPSAGSKDTTISGFKVSFINVFIYK